MSAPQPGTPTPEQLGQMCAEAVNPLIFEPMIRSASERIYDALLDDVQNYLKSNVEYNIASEVDCIRRELAELRLRSTKAQALADASTFLLARLDELDWSLSKDDFAREHAGHVDPAISRFRAALAAWDAKP